MDRCVGRRAPPARVRRGDECDFHLGEERFGDPGPDQLAGVLCLQRRGEEHEERVGQVVRRDKRDGDSRQGFDQAPAQLFEMRRERHLHVGHERLFEEHRNAPLLGRAGHAVGGLPDLADNGALAIESAGAPGG